MGPHTTTGVVNANMNNFSGKQSQSQSDSEGADMAATMTKRKLVKTISDEAKPTEHRALKYGTTKSLPAHNGHVATWKGHSLGHSYNPHHFHHHHHQHPHHYGYEQQSTSLGHASSRNAKGKVIHSTMPFRRHIPEKKEHAISFFDIDLDKTEKYQYRPGEEVKGCIHMDVQKSIEIRYLELIIVGQGTATLNKSKHGLSKTQKETYIHKQTCVIGTSDTRWTSVLTPGHYTSNFRVKLPKNLPSSMNYEDQTSGFTFEVSYFLKIRLCDDVGSASMRSVSSTNNMVKILMSKKQSISVQRPFDLNMIPNALTPVVNDEEVIMSCANNSVAQFSMSLDRAVFLAGDDIRLQMTTQLPSSLRIKDITCILQQHITLKENGDHGTFVLSQMSRKDPERVPNPSAKRESMTTSSFDVTIPTQTDLITSFLYGCENVQVTYTLEIVIKFSPVGGKLSFSIPIGMGPCAEPIYAEKAASRKFVPIFNRPVRFPCFSPSSQSTQKLNTMDRSSRSSQSINVTTKYTNGVFGRCFMCCLGSTTDDY